MKNAFWDLNLNYGYLSSLTHVSCRQSLENIVGNQETADYDAVSLTPIYNKERCRYFYIMHIVACAQLTYHITQLNYDMHDVAMLPESVLSIYCAVETIKETNLTTNSL